MVWCAYFRQNIAVIVWADGLYEARKELLPSTHLRAILAGGRIPNYHQACTQFITSRISRIDA